jgi:hypothetical protein
MLGMETAIVEPHLKLFPSVEYQRYRASGGLERSIRIRRTVYVDT